MLCAPKARMRLDAGYGLLVRRQWCHRPHALRILRPRRHFRLSGHRPQNPPSHQPRPRRNRHRPHHVRQPQPPRRRSQRTAQTTLRQPTLRHRHPPQHPPRRSPQPRPPRPRLRRPRQRYPSLSRLG